MSESVEQKVYELLGRPTRSPYGNLIPGLEELGDAPAVDEGFDAGLSTLGTLDLGGEGKNVVVRRIGEPVQTDPQLMQTLRRAGVRPGAVVHVAEAPGGGLVGRGGEAAELNRDIASHVFVAKA